MTYFVLAVFGLLILLPGNYSDNILICNHKKGRKWGIEIFT